MIVHLLKVTRLTLLIYFYNYLFVIYFLILNQSSLSLSTRWLSMMTCECFSFPTYNLFLLQMTIQFQEFPSYIFSSYRLFLIRSIFHAYSLYFRHLISCPISIFFFKVFSCQHIIFLTLWHLVFILWFY